ncbi:MAG: rhodanese-like domain-containing protein [Pseudomonadota bacterium]
MKQLVRTTFPDAPQLTVEELEQLLAGNSQQTLLIDVRDPSEYAVSHLPGAHCAQGQDLERRIKTSAESYVVVLYCSVGYRSSKAAQKLRELGWSRVYNLEGSIFEWANKGNSLVQGGPASQTPSHVVHPFDDHWGQLLDPELHSYEPLSP